MSRFILMHYYTHDLTLIETNTWFTSTYTLLEICDF